MSDQTHIASAKIGTAGGFITVLLAHITTTDILKTAVMATIGTVISFFISALLKYCINRWRK